MCGALSVCISPLIMVNAGKGALEETDLGWGDGQERGVGARKMLAVSEVSLSSSWAGDRTVVAHLRWGSGVGVTVGSMPVS